MRLTHAVETYFVALHRVRASGGATGERSHYTALGIRFEGERGVRFFRSTLVQTLFYGVFSAWVLWARSGSPSVLPGNAGVLPVSFDWRTAIWYLRTPVLQALF